MSKPLAERRGWSYVLQPLVPGSFFLGNAAGPEPVHQDAVSVPGFLGVINSFDGYVHTKRFDKGIEPGKFFLLSCVGTCVLRDRQPGQSAVGGKETNDSVPERLPLPAEDS